MPWLTLDGDGMPVLLADVPNAGTSTVDPNAASGNPRHDTRSGKFAPGGRKRGTSQAQANIDPRELAVRNDAVRDAARQYDLMTAEDATEFLKTRARDMNLVDMDEFLRMVRGQRLDDLADLLALDMGAKKGNVRLSGRRGYANRVFQGLSDEEVVGMFERMQRRGFSDKKVRDTFLRRIKDPDRRASIEGLLGDEDRR